MKTKLSLVIGVIFLAIGILFFGLPSWISSYLKNNSLYFKYEFFIYIAIPLILAAIISLIIGFIDLMKEKNSDKDMIPQKNKREVVTGIVSVICILFGIILIFVSLGTAVFGEEVSEWMRWMLFFGISLLITGIILRCKK